MPNLPALSVPGPELPTKCPVCRAVSVVLPDDRGMVYGCGARYARASDTDPWTGECAQYDEALYAERLARQDAAAG